MTAMDKYLGHSAAKLLSARLQSIFLINNYDYLVRFLKVGEWQRRLIA